MEYKFQYDTEEERLKILEENSDKYLVMVQNITEGNFLTFSDVAPQPSIDNQVRSLQEDNANLLLQVATLENNSIQQSTDTASLILQSAKLEGDNIKLAEDYATLILELTLKEVI